MEKYNLCTKICIRSILENKIGILFEDIPEKHLWKLYEFSCSLKRGLIPWEYIPVDIKDEIGVPRQDHGVDAMSIETDTPKTCLQVKYRSENGHISFREISTFYTLSKGIIGAEKLELATTLGTYIPKFSSALFERIDVSKDDFMNHLNEILKEDIPIALYQKQDFSKFVLRSYQRQAVNNCTQALNSGKVNISLNMACGTGKSFVIYRMCQKYMAQKKKVCVVVPNRILFSQLYERFKTLGRISRIGNGYEEDVTDCDLCMCMYQSASKLNEKGIKFQCVFIDEAHHVIDCIDENGDVNLKKETRKIRNDVLKIPTNKKVLFSGTINDNFTNVYTYSFETAISEGQLCDYEIIIPVFSNSIDIKKKDENIDIGKEYSVFLERHLEWTKVLAYCNSCQSALNFCNSLKSNGIAAQYIDGKMSKIKRNEIIADFEYGNTRVLCTVGVLCEGVDIPCANTCIFVEQRNSRINILQCIGRILRNSSGKERAWIVLPTTDEEYTLVKFLKILCGVDEKIAKTIKARKLGGRLNIEMISESKHCEKFKFLYENIYNRIGCLVKGDKWDYMYDILKIYVENNKKIPSQHNTDKDHRTLGMWCTDQRKSYKNKILSNDRITKLEKIDGWFWNHDEIWQNKYDILKIYVENNKKIPSQHSKNADDRTLGKWCNNQKQNYKNKKLPNDRIEKFEKIDGWFWKHDEIWQNKYDILKIYVENNKKIPSEHSKNKDDRTLAKWCNNQKQNYKNKILSNERITKLEKIDGWFWIKS